MQLGGYWLPFVALGCGILLAATITYLVLPVSLNDPDMTENTNKESVVDLLNVPSICVAVLSLFVASTSIGFLFSSLEPHMRQFDISPLMMGKQKSEWGKIEGTNQVYIFHIVIAGAMFAVLGGTYALTGFIFGSICDRFLSSPMPINFLGISFITLAFFFLGPAPFLGLPTLMPVCVAALILHGCGLGAVFVSSFCISHTEAIASGFSNNINTYGLVSGLWTSTFALGAFVGPSAAGILLEHFGFPWATMFISCFGLFLLVAGSSTLCYKYKASLCTGDQHGFLPNGERSFLLAHFMKNLSDK